MFFAKVIPQSFLCTSTTAKALDLMKIQIMPSSEDCSKNFSTSKVLEETLFMIGHNPITNVQYIFDSQDSERDVIFDFMKPWECLADTIQINNRKNI